jgi:Zn-dependent peptidase ImmA (M78 family)
MKTISEVLEIVNHFRERVPVDVRGLALALGASISEDELDPTISGILHKHGEGRFSITVNSRHPRLRRRFTIAHEIGHLIFHSNLIGDGIIDNKAYRAEGIQNRSKIGQRTEANKFAANLLMPATAIINLQDEGITSVKEIAERLGVSEAAVSIRLSATKPPVGA